MHANKAYQLVVDIAPGVYANTELLNKALPLSTSNKPPIIIYIRGKEFTKEQWQKRPVRMRKFLNFLDGLVDEYYAITANAIEKEIQILIDNAVPGSIDQKRNYGCCDYYFTGHGTGGALSILSAILFNRRLARLGQIPPTIIITTFGQPKIGDEIFNEWVKARISELNRVTYFDDFVPEFPKTLKHISNEIWIAEEQNCDCQQQKEEGNEADGQYRWPEVYECFPVLMADNPYCNAQYWSQDPQIGVKSHEGPYFGYYMRTSL
ncbi:hypothetical protein G9A89_004929 [Geosiphon pyriformis]|nr:hypothetical protein G9A89_004929 [Geosiphon pyriformis]